MRRLASALTVLVCLLVGGPSAVADGAESPPMFGYDALASVVASPSVAQPAEGTSTTPSTNTRIDASIARSGPLTSPGDLLLDSGFFLATKGAPDPPNRIYSARELRRRAAEPGPFHNFPESFNDQIFERGTRSVTRGFFNQPRRGLSNDSVQYRLRGEINGRSGTYEIFARPSLSGRTEVIQHRFFKPDSR